MEHVGSDRICIPDVFQFGDIALESATDTKPLKIIGELFPESANIIGSLCPRYCPLVCSISCIKPIEKIRELRTCHVLKAFSQLFFAQKFYPTSSYSSRFGDF